MDVPIVHPIKLAGSGKNAVPPYHPTPMDGSHWHWVVGAGGGPVARMSVLTHLYANGRAPQRSHMCGVGALASFSTVTPTSFCKARSCVDAQAHTRVYTLPPTRTLLCAQTRAHSRSGSPMYTRDRTVACVHACVRAWVYANMWSLAQSLFRSERVWRPVCHRMPFDV